MARVPSRRHQRRLRQSRSRGVPGVRVPGRRALTLIELVAAIAVMVVLSAIAMPVIAGRVAGARFESAARQIESFTVLSRAESQRRGEALELVVETTGATQRFTLEAWRGTETGSKPGDSQPSGLTVLGEFGEGISVSDKPPVAGRIDGLKEGGDQEVLRGAAVPPLREAIRGQRTVLATFLPDGTATVGGPIYLSDRERTVEVRLNTWTGAATVKDYEPPKDETDQGKEPRGGSTMGPEAEEDPKEM